MKKLIASVAGLAVLVAGAAEARAIYTYEMDPATPRVGNAGTITALSAQYDSLDQLGFSATLALTAAKPVADGGWFVFSPGGLPTSSDGELAIFYMDFAGGDLYAYRYNGLSDSASWKDPSRYIATYEDVLSVSEEGGYLTVSFADLDVSGVQSAVGGEWTGASFAEAFGGWIHFTALDEFAAENGVITAFDTSWQSYLDVADRPTAVPEPAGLAALGLMGVLGAAAWRRRAKA